MPHSRFVRPAVGYDANFIGKSEQKAFTGYHTLWPLFMTFVRVADHAALTFRPTCGRVRCKLYRKKREKGFLPGIIQFAGLRKATLSEKKSTQELLPRPFGGGDFLFGLEND